MKVISVIGFSGSGKTHFIVEAIKLLGSNLNLKVACIKNIHEHSIDSKGKDSYEFTRAGAIYSITKNKYNEHTIFIKREIVIDNLIEWVSNGPLIIDLIFIEGFKKLNYPEVLCVKKYSEIEKQLSKNVKMISGILLSKGISQREYKGIPLRDGIKDFNEFIELFEIDKVNV